MTDSIEISIEVEDSELEEAERNIEDFETKSNNIVNEVDRRSTASFMKVMNMARNTYAIGLGLAKATGASISYFFRSMISAAFGAISILQPIIAAEAVTPGMQVQAALGAVELGVAISAVIAAEAKRSDIARNLRGVAMTLGGIQSLIGNIYYLG